MDYESELGRRSCGKGRCYGRDVFDRGRSAHGGHPHGEDNYFTVQRKFPWLGIGQHERRSSVAYQWLGKHEPHLVDQQRVVVVVRKMACGGARSRSERGRHGGSHDVEGYL